MKNTKLIFLFVMLLLLITVAIANYAQTENPKIAVLMPSLDGYIYVANLYGIMDEAEKLGIEKPIVLAAGGYDKLDVQVKQVEDMIASGVDSIIIMPLSRDGVVPVLDRAVDNGIKVVEMGNYSSSKKVHTRIRVSQYKLGQMMAEVIGKELNGEGNVVMFNGPAGSSWAIEETEGFKSVIEKKYPNINILAERWTVYDAGVAMNTMNDLLQAFPKIDYVYASYDTYAEGAARALKAAGKEGKIKMITACLTPTTLQMLKDGALDAVVGVPPVEEGRLNLRAAVKLAKGEEVPAQQWVPLELFKADEVKENMNIDVTKNFFPEGWKVPK